MGLQAIMPGRCAFRQKKEHKIYPYFANNFKAESLSEHHKGDFYFYRTLWHGHSEIATLEECIPKPE